MDNGVASVWGPGVCVRWRAGATVALLGAAGVLGAGLPSVVAAPSPRIADRAELERLAAHLAPVDLRVSLDGLSTGDRAALPLIVEAAELMDTLFIRQV